jgi:ribose transport system permease protein
MARTKELDETKLMPDSLRDSTLRGGADENVPKDFVSRWERLEEMLRSLPGRDLATTLLSGKVIEGAVPVILLVIVVAWLGIFSTGFFAIGSLLVTVRLMGELGLVAIGMTIVVVVGGIDLSVGGIYALCNFVALYLMQNLQWQFAFALPAILMTGAVLGAFNGILIGYFRLRAFLTTLISLVIFRAGYAILVQDYGNAVTTQTSNDPIWSYLAYGNILGVPFPAWLCAGIAILVHFVLTRLRLGWRIMAIGGSRRAAYNAGVPVARTVLLCYVASGVLTGLSATFVAARLGDISWDVGLGLEIKIFTGIIAGGITLGGGKGTVTRGLLGLLVVLLLVNGLTAMSFTGGVISLALGLTLIVASLFEKIVSQGFENVRGMNKFLAEYLRLAPPPSVNFPGSAWHLNDQLSAAEMIALGHIEGADDIIFDQHGDLYAGSRHGDIIRFYAPDFTRQDVVAHIGSAVLGLGFAADGVLYACAGEMGLYRIAMNGALERVADHTRRSRISLRDSGRLRVVDDLSIATDGRVFFSENNSWTDLFTADRSGRVLCYDPNTNQTNILIAGLRFPNGVCLGPDHQSLLIALTTECAVLRYWFEGTRKGQSEYILSNLPGHPGNINAASDGNYWMSIVAGRAPAIDLAWRMPGFRKRMALSLPREEWPAPQMNVGGALKFRADGAVLEVLWDSNGQAVSSVTSLREHMGYLYLSSGLNNRIGRYRLSSPAHGAGMGRIIE